VKPYRETRKDNEEYEQLGIEEIVDAPENSKKFGLFGQVNAEVYHRKTADEILKSRPSTAHIQKKEKEESDMTYPDLFNRAERTKCAVFTKHGNLSYTTPTQRIGIYMDYSANLKRSHLLDIISYLRVASGKHLFISEKSTPEQYLKTCLFHGYMKEEDKGHSNNQYDPSVKQTLELLEHKKMWTSKLRREVLYSLKRYNHYIKGGEIKPDEVAPYNKKWMGIILERLGDEGLLRASEDHMRVLYKEVIANYVLSVNRAIMNYMLRSPLERKRLQITLIPRTILSSNELTVCKGGYNIEYHTDWHNRKEEALEDIKVKLLVNNIVMSALQSWFQEFRGFHFLNFKNLSPPLEATISISNFFDLQHKYRRKVKGIFKHIWHRGIVMILYQFKYLKRAGYTSGKFTLKRYVPLRAADTKNENVDYAYLDNIKTKCTSDEEIAAEYSHGSIIDMEAKEFLNIVEKEELEDIRESAAYKNYVKFLHGTINFDDDNYKSLTKEYRTELKYSAGNLMHLQMRAIIEQTLELVNKYFKRFETAEIIKLNTAPLNKVRKLRTDYSETLIEDRRKQKLQKEPEDLNGLEELLDQVCSGKIATKPLWRIGMEVQNGKVRIRESAESIITGMLELVGKVAKTFDKFAHPGFVKVAYISKKQLDYEEQDQKNKEQVFRQLHNNAEITDDIVKLKEQNMYKKYCANIRLVESIKEEKWINQGKDLKPFLNPLMKKRTNIGYFMNDTTNESETKYYQYKIHIRTIIKKFYDEAIQLLQIFSPFNEIINKEVVEEYKAFTSKENLVLEEYVFHVKEIDTMLNVISTIPRVFFMTMFEVSCSEIIDHLRNTLNNCKEILKSRMEEAYIGQCSVIINNFNNAEEVVRGNMFSPEEVQYIEAFKNSLILDTVNWKESAYRAHKILFQLMELDLVPNEQVMEATTALHFWPGKLRQTLEDVEEQHRTQRYQQERILKKEREHFEIKIEDYAEKMQIIETFKEIKDCDKVMETVSKLEGDINELRQQRDLINTHERLLFDYESPFEIFVKVEANFNPYSELWNNINKFNKKRQEWLQSFFSDLSAEAIEGQLKQNVRVVKNSKKVFDKKSHPAGCVVSEALRKETEEIQKIVPIVEILSNPGLKQRHWEHIQKILNAQFDWKNVTLKDIIAKGVEFHKEEITDISELASKEYSLEKSLQRMRSEWEKQEFVVILKPDTDIKLLAGNRLEEMQLLLDEHIVTAQQIRANPFVAPMEEEAIEWEKKLLTLRGVIEKWIIVQMDYIYLRPIFDSEDITKRLPGEAKKFLDIDLTWHELMDNLDKDKKALNVEQIPNLLEKLDNAKKDLEMITVNLNSYLEEKRKHFPRFYFLANDDMYDILGNTKNPRKVEAYLKKIFEGAQTLVFNEEEEIVGLRSTEKEEISFIRSVIPQDYHGNVETMLMDIEKEMKDAVSKEIEESIKSYASTTDRIEWLMKKWPGQVVLCVSQIFWCQNITQAIANQSIKELSDYFNTCDTQLKDIVKLVRGDLTKLQRITLSALIVLDVHANDVLNSLIANNVTSESAFEWLSQLRYYYNTVANVSFELICLVSRYKDDNYIIALC